MSSRGGSLDVQTNGDHTNGDDDDDRGGGGGGGQKAHQRVPVSEEDNTTTIKNEEDNKKEKEEKEWDVWRAAAYGNEEKLEQFTSADRTLVNATDANGFRPLQWAALNNRVAIANRLLDLGADVNAGDAEKQTALHWAAVRGALPVAELLLQRKATLHNRDIRGYTAAHVAAQYGHASMLYHFLLRWNLGLMSKHAARCLFQTVYMSSNSI